MDNMDNMDNMILEIKTVQSAAFRVLTEALKEILTDANFEFDESGIKIMAMDSSHTVLVHLKLSAENFEYYHCKNKRILGINMLNLFKLIKTMGNNDALTLYLEEGNESKLGIKIENSEKNTMTKYKLNLMDLHEDNIQIPPAVFDSVITMPSVDFQKICRDMHNLAENIEIKSLENQLIFSCIGQFASQETSIGETNTGLSFVQNQNPDEIVQGIFALKHLVLFSKCTNLCNNIELYLKNDYPLILKYQVASLGSIKLCLAPKCDNE
jgi:proliferating cell nuclear antigen